MNNEEPGGNARLFFCAGFGSLVNMDDDEFDQFEDVDQTYIFANAKIIRRHFQILFEHLDF